MPSTLASKNSIAMSKIEPIKPIEATTKQPELVRAELSDEVGAVPMNIVTKNVTSSSTRHWIPNHINKRVCRRFVTQSAADAEDPVCFCNWALSKHTDKVQKAFKSSEPQTSKWKPDDKHTVAVPTDAYGDVEFLGYKRSSKYVRLDHETPMDRVLELMLDQWELDPPNLLISVTGGARNFRMQPRLSEVFRRGLMKAASSTGAWIITGGMNAGVMKLVGKAVADHLVAHGSKTKVTAIGISCWGCVNNKESLVDTQNGVAQYRVEKPRKPKHASIDINHSHFLLVDNGTQMKYATEIAFRAQLEKKISNMGTATGAHAINVPVVCVVVEGGPGTLETVMRALQSGTPAVIVEGSGRSADVLAYAYWNSKETEVEATDQYGKKVKKMVPIFSEELWKEVRKMIYEEWGDRDIDSRVMWVQECFKHRHNMTVFRLDSGDLDVAILQALLKANKEHVADQLKLALAWNRIDVAQSDIFTEDMKWEKGELDEAMYMALINDRTDFVHIFLENGLSLKDFLSIKNLLKLYNDTPDNALLFQLLKRANKFGPAFSLEDVAEVIMNLIGDFFQPLYRRDTRYKNLETDTVIKGRASRAMSTISLHDGDINRLLNQLDTTYDHGFVKGLTKVYCTDQKTGEQFMLHDFDNPARELFIWAVLMNRMDMASVFWEEGKDSIIAALAAQKMLKSMAEITDDTDQMKQLTANAEKFSQCAVGVMSECHSADEVKAGLLLVYQQPNWGLTTALQLAYVADNKEFISHPACQTLLNTIWRGRLVTEVSNWRIWGCIFMPPLIYGLLTFRGDDRQGLSHPSHHEKKSKLMMSMERESMMALKEPGENPGHGHERNSIMSTGSKTKLLVEKDSDDDEMERLSCLDKLYYFYNAPYVIFMHNLLLYLAFLLLYSYIMLVDFHPTIKVPEIILIIWVFTLLTEEVRQVVMDESYSIRLKIQSYFVDPWNVVDVITLITYIIGLTLRFIPETSCTNCFTAGRIILSINLMIFIFRLLHVAALHKELGPKLVMIGRMMIDLLWFCIILFIFILAYGIATQAILYPNSQLDILLFRDIVRRPYWQIYGELFLEDLEGDNPCTNNLTEVAAGDLPRCPDNTWIGPVLLCPYLLVTNVLMLNLLIAMFSYTFENIQTNTDGVWKFQRYDLVKEFYERPPLAPPFIFIAHVYELVKCMAYKNCRQSINKSNPFKVELLDDERHHLVLWENMNQEEFYRNSKAEEQSTLYNQVTTTRENVVSLVTKVDEVAEGSLMLGGTGSSSNSSSTAVVPKLPPALDERMTLLEEQMKRTSQAIDWIIKSMIERGAGAKEGPPKLIDLDKMKKEAEARKAELEEREKEQYKEMLKRQLDLHVKSRTKQYPCTYEIVYRFMVPDDKVLWDEKWAEYDPTIHTDKSVLAGPEWADEDLMAKDPQLREILKYNDLDAILGVDRRSFCGKYELKKSLPINPKGRTGLAGRGLLGRWGPNHAGDPVVTRWCRNAKGEQIKKNDKPVLEFVSVQREDTKQWAIPGGLISLNQTVDQALKAEFSEEALGQDADEAKKSEFRSKINQLFKKGVEVYKGYSDDPRNTDNAWVETTAVNYHDEEGVLTHFTLRAGGSAEMVRWMRISTLEPLYAAHIGILQKVAKRLNADF